MPNIESRCNQLKLGHPPEILAAYVIFMVKESIEGYGKYTQISTLHRPNVQGSQLVPADPAITFLQYEDIERLEDQFRTKWQQSEQENLWNLIKQSASEKSEPEP